TADTVTAPRRDARPARGPLEDRPMTQTLDWDDTGTLAGEELSAGGARVLAVGDGVIGYTAALPAGMSAAEGLADFAAGYRAGDEPCEVAVDWMIWEGGEQVDAGSWSWSWPS